jgi:hypothetical protein
LLFNKLSFSLKKGSARFDEHQPERLQLNGMAIEELKNIYSTIATLQYSVLSNRCKEMFNTCSTLISLHEKLLQLDCLSDAKVVKDYLHGIRHILKNITLYI